MKEVEVFKGQAIMEVHETKDVLWQIANVINLGDKTHTEYNQRTDVETASSFEDGGDFTTSQYIRRLAVLRDPNDLELEGKELAAASTDFINDHVSLDGTMKPYTERLQNLFEEMGVAALNKSLGPTHVVKLLSRDGLETWAALRNENLFGYTNSKGQKALTHNAPTVIGTIATDELVERLTDVTKRSLPKGEQNGKT